MNATQRIALQLGLNLIELENLRDENAALKAKFASDEGEKTPQSKKSTHVK